MGSCSRQILDHIIALNERHLRRLIRDHVNYHHEDRIHDSLDKDTPNRRAVDSRPSLAATVISSARLGGANRQMIIHGREISWQRRTDCRARSDAFLPTALGPGWRFGLTAVLAECRQCRGLAGIRHTRCYVRRGLCTGGALVVEEEPALFDQLCYRYWPG